MRVGVYAPGLAREIGGGYTFEEEILRSLAQLQVNGKSRHQLLAFVDGTDPSPPGLEHVRLGSSGRKSLAGRLVRQSREALGPLWSQLPLLGLRDPFERLLQQYRIDFMYYPTSHALTLEGPYFITVWDLQHRLQPYFPEVSARGEWQAREAHLAHCLRRAAGVITGTLAGTKEIERFYQVAPERIKQLPHPTPWFALHPPAVDVPAVLNRHRIRDPYVFYPGQFWAHKNHVGLLKALRVLRQDCGLRLVAVFAGSDQGNEGYVRRVSADLGLGDAVHYLGFVSREDLVALYRGAVALVYLTYFGPENLPPLEAFALDCPVIASTVAGSEEQLGDAAMQVDPSDANAVAAAVKALHDDPALRARLIERGRIRALRFTGHDYANGLLELLDEFETVRRCWGAAS